MIKRDSIQNQNSTLMKEKVPLTTIASPIQRNPNLPDHSKELCSTQPTESLAVKEFRKHPKGFLSDNIFLEFSGGSVLFKDNDQKTPGSEIIDK